MRKAIKVKNDNILEVIEFLKIKNFNGRKLIEFIRQLKNCVEKYGEYKFGFKYKGRWIEIKSGDIMFFDSLDCLMVCPNSYAEVLGVAI